MSLFIKSLSRSASSESVKNPDEAFGLIKSSSVESTTSSGSVAIPMAKEVEKEQDGTLTIVAVVVFYIFSSISTILLNKMVLKVEGTPSLLVLWGQMIVAVVILQIARLCKVISLPPVNFTIFKQLLGLIAINVVGLTLNTLCLANIDAVLYQVARSMILPMTVSMSPFILGQYPSPKILLSCAVIFVGFFIGIFGERHFSTTTVTTTGIVFGVLSSFSTSCHSFIIKSSFGKVQSQYSGTFDLVFYNNLFSAFLLLPVLLFERTQIEVFVRSAVQDSAVRNAFIWGTILSGASGLLINLAGFLQIKVTSPITHTVSSAARGVLQTIAAHFFLGEAITLPRCIGIGVTLFGSCLYSLFKTQESNNYKRI